MARGLSRFQVLCCVFLTYFAIRPALLARENKYFTYNASAAMLVARVSCTSEGKGFPRRRDHCFMHAQPIRRPLFSHVTSSARF